MDFGARHLRAFLAVAETGSLGRAARIVNLTQPSLSRQIQSMEDQLGHHLFDRGGRGMALTAAGALLVPHARHLLFEMDNTRDELAALHGLRRGTVRIGAVASVMRTLVAETVGALRREAPDLAVQLLEAVDGELLDALVGRQVDLVVASCPLAHPEIEQLGACAHGDRFAVFCAADHPLPDDSTLQQVLAADWVMPGRALTPRATFESLVDALGVHRPRIAVETSSVEAMVAVASRSNLLCWLPEPLVAAQIANGVIRRLVVPELTVERRFVLHCRRSGLLPDAARLFVRHFPFEAAGA